MSFYATQWTENSLNYILQAHLYTTYTVDYRDRIQGGEILYARVADS
jgi:hypothetical protein